jgi:hypothetical protein
MTVRVHGLRGKYSPMNYVSDVHKEKILEVVENAKRDAHFEVTVRHTSYIGPGCAAEYGAVTVTQDGKIFALVFPPGNER